MGIHARLEPFRSTALRLARRRSLRAAAAPLFIGGTGGSGTRVVAQIVAHAGVFLGRELNRAGDSEPVGRYLRRWIPRYLRADGRVPEHERAAMNRELQVALIRHRRGIPARDGPWGAKNPRSMYLLPYLWERVPNLRFLHLVRNGLDMAFSRNQNQLQAYGALVLGEEHEGEPEPARSVALWAEANTRCHGFATSHLGPRYLLLRFEDVCRDPRGSAASIFDFLDAPATNLAAAAACVRPPHTLGRQARADEAVLEALRERAGPALRLFGYGSAR